MSPQSALLPSWSREAILFWKCVFLLSSPDPCDKNTGCGVQLTSPALSAVKPREKTVWLFTRTPVERGALGRPSKDALLTVFFRLMFTATSSASSPGHDRQFSLTCRP